jgi:hypothetical protein
MRRPSVADELERGRWLRGGLRPGGLGHGWRHRSARGIQRLVTVAYAKKTAGGAKVQRVRSRRAAIERAEVGSGGEMEMAFSDMRCKG